VHVPMCAVMTHRLGLVVVQFAHIRSNERQLEDNRGLAQTGRLYSNDLGESDSASTGLIRASNVISSIAVTQMAVP
jgi:hypothetical protein